MLGRVYIIRSPNTDDVYIGSTTMTLKKRFSVHKTPSNQTTSYLVIDEGDATIELLEEIKVIDKRELEFYENQYLELYRDIAVNGKGAFGEDKKTINKKDYENHREKRIEKHKIYREKNREKNKLKVECTCGSVIRKYEIPRHNKTQKHKNYVDQDKE